MIRIATRTRRAERAHDPIAHPAAPRRAAAAIPRLAVLACAFGMLASCASGPSVDPQAQAGVNLAGSWRLNRQASGDPDSMISAIVEKEMKHMRRGSRREDDDDVDDLPPPPAPGEAGTGHSGRRQQQGENVTPPGGMFRPREGMAAYIRSQYTNALGSLLGNGEGLIVEQATDRFALRRGDSRRSFTPGGHSVVGVTDGVADQTSGWKGREYIIDVRPQVGPRVTERYGLSPDGSQLIEKVSLSGDGLKKLDFTRVYDKGSAPPRTLPGS